MPAVRYLRILMFIIALALPIFSLAVLGSLWLWQHGYVLYWSIAALSATALAFAAERWMLRDAFRSAPIADSGNELPVRVKADRETAAWNAVVTLAEKVDPQAINSRDSVLDLGKATIEVVARHMHPDHKEPMYRFTLPELMALTANVSSRLEPFIRKNIPLGDRLTVGQIMTIYRWRGAIDFADRAYDIWRTIRLMNPATAVTQELREKFTRQLYEWGRSEVGRRLVGAYVREIGRAAIDLYSGRLRYPNAMASPDESNQEAASSAFDIAQTGVGAVSAAAEHDGTSNSPKENAVRLLFRQIGNAAKLITRGGRFKRYL